MKELDYLGHHITKEGIQPTERVHYEHSIIKKPKNKERTSTTPLILELYSKIYKRP
jgi:hypothetical protein